VGRAGGDAAAVSLGGKVRGLGPRFWGLGILGIFKRFLVFQGLAFMAYDGI
jgi:hypothetical protein